MAPAPGQAFEQCLDLVAFQEVGLRWCSSLRWDGGHLLADAEHLGFTGGDVLEEDVQGRQTLVASPDMIGPVVLQVAEEGEDALERQVIDVELCDLLPLVLGHEAQQ